MLNVRRDLSFGVMIRSFGNKTAQVQECQEEVCSTREDDGRGHSCGAVYPEERRGSCISLNTRVLKRGEQFRGVCGGAGVGA